jgi:hypothetical protein
MKNFACAFLYRGSGGFRNISVVIYRILGSLTAADRSGDIVPRIESFMYSHHGSRCVFC